MAMAAYPTGRRGTRRADHVSRRNVMIKHENRRKCAAEDGNTRDHAKRRAKTKSGTSVSAGITLLSVIPMPLALIFSPFLLTIFFLAASFFLLSSAVAIIAALIFAPAMLVLAACPKFHLSGYQQLESDTVRTEGSSPPIDYDYGSTSSAKGNNDFPMLAEVRGLLMLSDLAYLYIDFRRLVMLGKMPVDFKYIMLECDEMNQSEIIRGAPHRKVAFGPNGESGAGMRPITIWATVMRFLSAEAQRLRVKNISKVLWSTSIRSSLSGSGKKEESAYEGLKMFEDLFLRGLKHTAQDCRSHAMGGTLCSCLGLHGMQCFVDSLAREAHVGDANCEELLETLANEDVDDDFDSEVAKIGKLMHLVSQTGNVFKKGSFLCSLIAAKRETDHRIVWTNDRMGDAECVYIIAVSHMKRCVTVIFRGTTTVNDIFQNADFGAMAKPNPIKEDYPGKSELIEMHSGYCQYLLTKRDDSGKTKIDEIAERVHKYGEEIGKGGYSIYVTGHSMGGALATIFGLYASTQDRFTQGGNPVRVVTFASAIPGRISFAKAFQRQEKVGLLQHLRITNDNDIVPLAHPQDELTFAHTGVSLTFHEDKTIPSIKYVQDPDWWGTWTANIQTNLYLNFPWRTLAVGRNHGTINYMKRYENIQSEVKSDECLGKMTLNDVYSAYVKLE
eukprot:CAMPEP_0172549460 /NCGR_PEP_ID=MMETSP1067-20121228/18545_1 /TAXON_ID=265564 ORGANISM="Thalassiosira punctigera, Strain Tpunct2005C2" /NCGR_SAMPLE_ID=MMETSP1067 /ASSEMBLY_ACC=CAM_ASM_000444 /LENGTH=670 /DNA_ID=CAMNT_0013336851 /DNA_START=190 /DNA_END=2202 /DNA_ORIENTATION=+